ncbi:Rossmann-like and DUF2520 domain-containing protein [Glaciimonas soli]|uniref:DUF2520 domain-containing protein n=1 Tax=Glaciimonas soli TaxID=2590999 RepID=A0A843YKX7_9BURK|nr:Rossmann-like and DUF2520 domain-containing protein [Glaciimonas soli]MQR00045.1 DUF2520 domain-containing protein [Glaciimonas soli]
MAGSAGSSGKAGELISPKSLNIIGCGKVGQTLAQLWSESGTFQLHDILNRSLASGQRSVIAIGDGRAVADYAELYPADVYLIGTGDDQISACCDALAASGKLNSNSIVFHCSGALSSDALSAAKLQGASVASIHPIRSFANPQQVVSNFSNTWCGCEGDTVALAFLISAFETIGARCVDIARDNKILYHAAAVFASNYVITLIDAAQRSYIEAGIPADVALQLISPLLTESAENAFRSGPATALTGPIARGDSATVTRQYQALLQWEPQTAALYQQFIELTSRLAEQKHKLPS